MIERDSRPDTFPSRHTSDIPSFKEGPIAEEAEILDPEIGETFLVLRKGGQVEEWTVSLNEAGEKVLASELPDGWIGEKPLSQKLISPETQQALAAERERQARITEAHEAIDNLKIEVATPPVVLKPTHLPAASVESAVTQAEPFIADEREQFRGVTSISPEPTNGTVKKKWWQR